MSEPDLFDALRRAGIDADAPEIRAAVRAATVHVDLIAEVDGPDVARRCLVAMHAALGHRLRHPGVDDMSTFEDDYDQDE